jgi:hypothetical protein
MCWHGVCGFTDSDTQGSHRKPLHAVKAKYEPICLELFGDEDGEDESSCEGSGEENGEESEEGSEESEDETTNQPPENTDWLILNPEDSADEAADRLDEAEEDSDDSKGEDVSEEEEDDSEEEVVTFNLKPSRQSASSQVTPKKAVSPAKSPVKPVTPAQSSEAAPQVVVTPKQASGSKKRATPPAGDASKAFTTPKKRVMIAVQSSTAIGMVVCVCGVDSRWGFLHPHCLLVLCPLHRLSHKRQSLAVAESAVHARREATEGVVEKAITKGIKRAHGHHVAGNENAVHLLCQACIAPLFTSLRWVSSGVLAAVLQRLPVLA